MNVPKHSTRCIPNMTQQAGETSSKEEELGEKITQLSTVNGQLVQEVQRLKEVNAHLYKRFVEVSKQRFEVIAEKNRMAEVLNRVNSRMLRFLPCLVQGTELLQNVLKDVAPICSPPNPTQRSSARNEGNEDVNSGGTTSVSPQRTGIAMPMVKGHSISKPSVSLHRVVPGQSAASSVPLPIRDLNLADIVRAEDQNRQLSEVREESDWENGEESDQDSEDNDHLTEGNENRSGRSEDMLLENEHSSEGNNLVSAGNEHNSEENGHHSEANVHHSEENEHHSEANEHNSEANEHNSEANEHNSEANVHHSEANEHNSEANVHHSEENEPGQVDGNDESERHNLSVVEEESTFVDEGASGLSEPQEAIAPDLSPITEEDALSCQAGTSSRVRQTQSFRLSWNKSKPEEPEVDSSDDEDVALSLLEMRSKLMNGNRRKELKEGTSKDYIAKTTNPPISRRKLKRKKTQEDETVNEERNPNETSALRKSFDGLLSSLKKKRVSRKGLSNGDSPLRRVNEFAGVELDPRVSLVRMSEFLKSGLSKDRPDLVETEEEFSERELSPKTPFMAAILSPVDVPADVTLLPATPRAPSPFMVTKRRRCSYITTRNKKSARQAPGDEVVAVVDEVETVEVQMSPPPQRLGTKRRRSWKESIRKRNKIPSESDSPPSDTATEGSEELRTGSNNRTLTPTDQLPTVVLDRCSDSFIARNSSIGALNDLTNDSVYENAGTQLAYFASRATADNVPSPGNVPIDTAPAQPTKAKPRSKPKPKSRSKPSAKMAKSVSNSRTRALSDGLSGIEHESHTTLDPSSLNTSLASSIGDAENSRGSIDRNSGASRPRRAKAPISLKEKPLNRKMRRT